MSGKLAKGLYRYYIRINRSLFMFGYNTYIVANDKVIISGIGQAGLYGFCHGDIIFDN